jgi:hypothetical protein
MYEACMQFHSDIISALRHPSTWAGISGVMSSMGTQLDKPFSILCYCLSAVCSIVAIIVKTPDPEPADKTSV